MSICTTAEAMWNILLLPISLGLYRRRRITGGQIVAFKYPPPFLEGMGPPLPLSLPTYVEVDRVKGKVGPSSWQNKWKSHFVPWVSNSECVRHDIGVPFLHQIFNGSITMPNPCRRFLSFAWICVDNLTFKVHPILSNCYLQFPVLYELTSTKSATFLQAHLWKPYPMRRLVVARALLSFVWPRRDSPSRKLMSASWMEL